MNRESMKFKEKRTTKIGIAWAYERIIRVCKEKKKLQPLWRMKTYSEWCDSLYILDQNRQIGDLKWRKPADENNAHIWLKITTTFEYIWAPLRESHTLPWGTMATCKNNLGNYFNDDIDI